MWEIVTLYEVIREPILILEYFTGEMMVVWRQVVIKIANT